MTPDNDGYIDVDLGDEPDSPAGEVLDVVLDASPVEALGPTSTAPRVPAKSPVVPEAELPMLAGGVCSRCGYALRPLEEHCPRCERGGAPAQAPEVAVESQPEADLPAVRRGCSIWAVLGLAALFLSGAALLSWLWYQPGLRAKREYRAGLQAQLSGSFETARQHYLRALELDPDMGLAALSIGTTYLRIGDPAIVSSIQSQVERAVQGQTDDLDAADRWFRAAVEAGARLPPSMRLMDPKISTPPKLRAFAHAFLALTALIRASAALQADQLEDGVRWLAVVQAEAQMAVADDPGNENAEKILRAMPPQGSFGPGLP